jgi:tyrosine-protein kinase Etk/Wzc
MQPNGHTNPVTQNGHHGTAYYEEFRTLNWYDYIRILRRRWWILLASFAVIFMPTLYYNQTAMPVYRAAAIIMVQDNGGMQSVLFEDSFMRKSASLQDQVYLLQSSSIAESVVKNLMQSEVRDSLTIVSNGLRPAVSALRRSLVAEPVKGTTSFIEIAVRGASPFEAAYLANAVADVYQGLDQEFSRGEIHEVVEFLDAQLKMKERDLRESEESLKQFQERENISSLTGDAQETVNQVAAFEAHYNNALTELQAYKKRLEYLNQQLGQQTDNLQHNISQISNPLILKLRDELAETERKASVLIAQGISEDYTDLKMLRSKQHQIKERLVAETHDLIVSGLMPNDPLTHAQELVGRVIEAETEMRTLQARADALGRVVEGYNRKLEQLPQQTLRLARLERHKKVDENLYMMMKEKYEESRISMAGQIGKVRLVDSASEPVEPVEPKKQRNLVLGALFGVGLGVMIIMLLEFMDKSMRSVEDVERLGLAMVGIIPHFEPPHRRLSFNGNGHPDSGRQYNLITKHNPRSPIAEAYRTLRTNVQFSMVSHKSCAILVTSSGPGEGKSTTVTNLGVTFANMGKRTLIIDADLRRPVLHRAFDLDKNHGLTSLLRCFSGDHFQATGVDNLYVLTSGVLPLNPSEMLGSDNMRTLLNELKKHFEMIIMDSPPVIAVTDAMVLASKMDGVLLVVKAGQSQLDMVKRAKEMLHGINARLLGAVLNDVRPDHMTGSYYYYYKNYYAYGDTNATGSDKQNGEVRRKRRPEPNPQPQHAPHPQPRPEQRSEPGPEVRFSSLRKLLESERPFPNDGNGGDRE